MHRTVHGRVLQLAVVLMWVFQFAVPIATLAAQGGSLSKITGHQLVKHLKLPAGTSLHDPTADCQQKAASPCNKELFETVTESVFMWQAEDGSMKQEVCPESRRFIPGNRSIFVIVMVGFCNQGGFTKNTLKSSIDAADVWTRRALLPKLEPLSSEEVTQRKQLEMIVGSRRFPLDPNSIVNTFLHLSRGHPAVFVPTATITSTRDTALFVLQAVTITFWNTGDRPEDLALFSIHDLLLATAKSLHETIQ